MGFSHCHLWAFFRSLLWALCLLHYIHKVGRQLKLFLHNIKTYCLFVNLCIRTELDTKVHFSLLHIPALKTFFNIYIKGYVYFVHMSMCTFISLFSFSTLLKSNMRKPKVFSLAHPMLFSVWTLILTDFSINISKIPCSSQLCFSRFIFISVFLIHHFICKYHILTRKKLNDWI